MVANRHAVQYRTWKEYRDVHLAGGLSSRARTRFEPKLGEEGLMALAEWRHKLDMLYRPWRYLSTYLPSAYILTGMDRVHKDCWFFWHSPCYP